MLIHHHAKKNTTGQHSNDSSWRRHHHDCCWSDFTSFIIITFIIKQNHLLHHAVCVSLKMNGWERIHHLLLSKMRQSLLFLTFLLVVTIRSQQFLLLMWRSHCIITISFCFFHDITSIGHQMRIGRCRFLSRTANLLWVTALVVLCCARICWGLIVFAPPRSITCNCSAALHPCWYSATSTGSITWA